MRRRMSSGFYFCPPIERQKLFGPMVMFEQSYRRPAEDFMRNVKCFDRGQPVRGIGTEPRDTWISRRIPSERPRLDMCKLPRHRPGGPPTAVEQQDAGGSIGGAER